MTPYYQDALVTLYHGDSRDRFASHVFPLNEGQYGPSEPWTTLTDPPYGIDYESGKEGRLPRYIVGDASVEVRDTVLRGSPTPQLVFGTWKTPAPLGTRAVLVWDKGPALGMGALDIPWKPSWDLIYVIGSGFVGRREGGVLRFPPVQSMAANGRVHPHEKPLSLLRYLIERCPPGGIYDPFVGSGSTLVAAKSLGRRAIGIEVDERYCEVAANRCRQEVLGLTA